MEYSLKKLFSSNNRFVLKSFLFHNKALSHVTLCLPILDSRRTPGNRSCGALTVSDARFEAFKITGSVVTSGLFSLPASNLSKRPVPLDSFHNGLCGLFLVTGALASCLWVMCSNEQIHHNTEVLITSLCVLVLNQALLLFV